MTPEGRTPPPPRIPGKERGRRPPITKAGEGFIWAQETRPDVPLVRNRDGTINQPLVAYFGHSTICRKVSPGSMMLEAYALREWFDFLEHRGKPWHRADDAVMRSWRELHRAEITSGRIKKERVEYKLHCVFEFYLHVHDALRLLDDLSPVPRFVDPDAGKCTAHPISSRKFVDKFGREHVSWRSGGSQRQRDSKRRPTPERKEVSAVLTVLRTRGDRVPTRRPTRTALQQRALLDERDWSLGCLESEAGLRRAEAAGLTLDRLMESLETESISIPERCRVPGEHALDTVGGDEAAKSGIILGLEGMLARHRKHVYVHIIGKGGSGRDVPFPISLVQTLLMTSIWHVRRGQVRLWREADPRYRPPPNVFLSAKTRGPMRAGSVGDLMGDAFQAAKVKGSGHRFRAFFAMETAYRLLDECCARNGYRYDDSIWRTVLDLLTEALGHSTSVVTMKHYVDLAILRHRCVTGATKLAALKRLTNVVADCQAAYTKTQVELITKVAEGLAAGEPGCGLEQMLRLLVNDLDLATNPVAAAASPAIAAGS